MQAVKIYKALPSRFNQFLFPRTSVSSQLTEVLKVKIEGSKIIVKLYDEDTLEYDQSEIIRVRPLGKCLKIGFLVYSLKGYFYTLETHLKL